MKRTLLLVLSILISVASFAQISPVYTNAFQHVLDSVCKKNKIKGVSAAIYRPGEGIWTGTYGESHAGTPITSDMILPIGSNTKTFVSAAILKLQEDGKIKLEDTIGTWITHKYVNGQITVKQLLIHTSGLADYTNDTAFFVAMNADYNKVWQPEDMYQFIDTAVAAPGATWKYCNTNYLLAGIIVSKIANKPLEQALRDLILTPQNLQKTFLFPQEQPTGVIPHGWSANVTGKLADMYTEIGYTNTAFLSMATGAGAYVSTAEDNVKFWHALMSGQIINAGSLAMMKDMYPLAPTQGYGLGLMKSSLNGRSIYSHGGTCFAFLNENLYDSVGGVYITVLSNQDSITNDLLHARVLGALHKITVKMPALGIKDMNTELAEAKIYPNPATDRLHIALSETGNNASVVIVDMTGKVAYSGSLKDGDNEISLSNFATGLYMTRINNNGLIQTQKIQVIK
ncbi:MAG: T9SS type A sorting domain-containing protein [Sphingobacteriales bacterium]|nr:MAG: T9SS type A sorting domain-containing protein [Sphingobacteriales bacterium]